MAGELGKEDEARLIEELANAKSDIKNMKIRQAMVSSQTHVINWVWVQG